MKIFYNDLKLQYYNDLELQYYKPSISVTVVMIFETVQYITSIFKTRKIIMFFI